MKRVFIVLILCILFATPTLASDVSVAPNQAKLEINGAVCAYCAYGMQKGLSKMECIDKTQGHKGVESDIENQIITIHLKEGKTVNLQEMSQKIRKSGYEPRTFHMRVKGQSLVEGDRRFILNSSNEKLYELRGEKAQQLAHNKTYDLQLFITEDAIKALQKNDLPVAQIDTIIKGE